MPSYRPAVVFTYLHRILSRVWRKTTSSSWKYRRQLQIVLIIFPPADMVVLDIAFNHGRYIDMPRVYSKMKKVETLILCHVHYSSNLRFPKLLKEEKDGCFSFAARKTLKSASIVYGRSEIPWRTDEGSQETF